MRRTRKASVLLAVAMMVWATAAAWAAPGVSFTDTPTFQDWMQVYDEVNGDHDVVLRLAPSRFLVTENTDINGYVKLDLIDGSVEIELNNLDRQVDVWALDNAPHTGFLPGHEGDKMIHLARLASDKGGVVRFETELGAEAFRGFELDWIFVSEAGADPAESRLLLSTRSYFERKYTQQRLTNEGFDVLPSPQPSPPESKSIGLATTPHTILVTKGLVTQAQFDGANTFFRETFQGNGRSCGTCHPPQNNQTIDKPFMATLPATDPLFVAEQRPAGDPISQLEVPALMRQFDLIVENVDGAENPTVKFVMRGVPHSLSLATSINPNDGIRTGWSGDGAPSPGTLRMFLAGAIFQHYPKNSLARVVGVDFRQATDAELDNTLEFLLNVGRLNTLDLNTVALTNANANSGRTSFINSGCNACHTNAGANASFAGNTNANLNTGVEALPNPAKTVDPAPLDATSYPVDGGFGQTGTGPLGGFGNGAFNTPPLIEAADTAPFFHNNTKTTIEQAVNFYSAAPFGGPFIFPGDTATQNNVAAFLRTMNATFNLQIAIQRNEAALVLSPGSNFTTVSNGVKATVNKILDLSNDDAEDASQVLTGGPLGNLSSTATAKIASAISFNDQAIAATSNSTRRTLINNALNELKAANTALGTGTTFTMGKGNLLF